jgi:membrane protein implicated in regulation of membrane protease activity
MRGRFPTFWRDLPALLAIAALIAGHGAVLSFLIVHQALPIAAVGALVLLIVLKHLGLAGPVYVTLARLIKRRGRRRKPDRSAEESPKS